MIQHLENLSNLTILAHYKPYHMIVYLYNLSTLLNTTQGKQIIKRKSKQIIETISKSSKPLS